jgi:hypothetical protein
MVPPCYEANSVSSSSSIGAELRCIFTPALVAAFFNFRHRRSVNAIALSPIFTNPPLLVSPARPNRMAKTVAEWRRAPIAAGIRRHNSSCICAQSYLCGRIRLHNTEQAIKNDTSLTKLQKAQKIRALHEETNPQVQAILSLEQFQQLQEIRRQEVEDMIQKKRATQQ